MILAKYIFLFGCLSPLLLGQEGPSDGAWQWLDSLPKPWTLSQREVSDLLPQFQAHYPDFYDRLEAIALWRVGTPYKIFQLGEETPPDKDPIIRLDVSDCTAHVLTSLAFSQSTSWETARQAMINIHYKPNDRQEHIPSYTSRWHYTTDRILHNPYTVNITDSLVAPQELVTVPITLNRKSDGTEFLDLDWEEDVTVRYIPNRLINTTLLEHLPRVCGVAFVRTSYFENGIVVAHEGMILDRKNLVHASMAAKQTELIDFLKYYFRAEGPLFDGIMIYKFMPFE